MRGGSGSSQSVLLTVNLKALTQTLTKKEQLDDKVERALSVLADEMLEDVVEFACRLAKHRGSNMLHKNDVKLAIEKRYKIKVPSRLHQPTGAAALANQSASASTNQNN
jgi:transcription initiation factor TFIID subunit TAF12